MLIPLRVTDGQTDRVRLHYVCLVLAWLSGSALVSINVVTNSTPGPVNTWMGDRLWASKPPRYVTSHLGQLSLPSLRGR